MKLVKIGTHYYVVDDSEIKEGDSMLLKMEHPSGRIRKCHYIIDGGDFEQLMIDANSDEGCGFCKRDEVLKITHSTENLEGVIKINLSDVEEAINGYSIVDMSDEIATLLYNPERHKDLSIKALLNIAYQEGFKACQELMKDKLFTANDMYSAYNAGGNDGALHESLMDYESHDSTDAEEFSKSASEEFKNSLLPKTEWEIEIVDDKIVLL